MTSLLTGFPSLPSRERGLKFEQVMWLATIWTSLPSRERGLKFLCPETLYKSDFVAPLAGAWVEILKSFREAVSAWSLPSRERGLKSEIEQSIMYLWQSLPSRERGLKFR